MVPFAKSFLWITLGIIGNLLNRALWSLNHKARTKSAWLHCTLEKENKR